MRAGKLDRIVTVERITETVSDSGAVASAWTTIATVRAELLQDMAAEATAGPGDTETITIGFRIRWLANITTADRVTYAGDAFNMVELKEIGRRRGLELRCERIRR